ncbi:nucleoside deaminase [Actinotalea ferrariae]|uniref:nucleoside deaminase n=1 Tax=Actinotalea ferrariae TaxID=1386098 RepID=UPI001C8BDFE3|nr:nucleoside deaminase [Actinotalea ferrariae]MBX9244746.1 nucleoside deaminase [Actinotalea ferrariae]
MGPTRRLHHPTTTTADDDERWLALSVAHATDSVSEGGGPFGAVVVRAGSPVASGRNRVVPDLDPTAHAEVVAIRAACRELGRFSLAGTTLYSSCEPCPLCLAAALWSRVDRLVFAADRDDAARAGFDDRAFHELFRSDPATWPLPVVAHRIDGATAPMDAWLAASGRTPY